MFNDAQWCLMYASHFAFIVFSGLGFFPSCPLPVLQGLLVHIFAAWKIFGATYLANVQGILQMTGITLFIQGVVTSMSHPGWLPNPPLQKTILWKIVCHNPWLVYSGCAQLSRSVRKKSYHVISYDSYDSSVVALAGVSTFLTTLRWKLRSGATSEN